MKVTAIDVSYCQTGVDYNKVKNSGIDAVIIRAGFGKETYQKDSEFETHYRNAKKAGLAVGVYWYSYAYSVAEAKQEAKVCLACIKGKTLELPVYYDLEESGQTRLGMSALTNIAIAFCDAIKSGGYRAGVYSNLNWLNNYLDYKKLRNKYSIWLAQWSSSPSKTCDIWQNADNGRINGINGNVDTDVIINNNIIKKSSTGDEEEMIKYGSHNTATLAFKKQLITLYNMKIIKTKVDNSNGFGDGTLKAVKEAQRAGKVTVDGIVGEKTINAIYHLINDGIRAKDNKIANAKKALG
jgi:GH25 family lysozyme M1 (1,4-beta-N-acetylmuramidase)